MRRVLVLSGVLMALAAPAAPAAAEDVDVALDERQVSTVVGDRFTVRSGVTNPGAAATGRLIAHLNVVSLTSDVYVDPEDWSASRTRELAPLGPGGRTTLSWELQAVNAGSFDVYVVVLPDDTDAGPLVVSPAVRVAVAGRHTLNAGGALPVAVVVPVLLGLFAVFSTLLSRGRQTTGCADTHRRGRGAARRDGP